MITTATVKLKKPKELDNLWIENELSEMGYNVVRWAIIDICDEELVLTVSHQL